MATLPSDRTKLTLAQGNQNPGNTLGSSQNKNALTEAYDTIDLLNQKVDTNYAAGAIGTTNLADGSVTSAKMAASSVGTASIVDANVTLVKMAAASVGTSQLVDGSVARAKIANSSVGSSQLDATLLTNFGDIAVQAEFARRGIDVMTYGALGDGSTNDTVAINAAITAVGSAKSTIIFPTGTYRIVSNLTIPNNITIWFMRGAMLSPDSGFTVTIVGTIRDTIERIFTGDGAVVISGVVKEVYPQWWGAVGDGVTDNQPFFQHAVDCLNAVSGGTIFVPRGTYMFNSGVKWYTNISMIGAGIYDTKFIVSGVLFDLFYNTDGASDGSSGTWLENCRFENFQTDLAGLTSTTAQVDGKAIFIIYMKRARFRNLYLKNAIGTALGCDFLVDTVIDNIVVENAGRNYSAGGVTVGQSGIGIGSCATALEPVVVSNCHVYNCGNYGIFVETQNNPSGVKAEHAKVVNCFVSGNKYGIGNKGSGGLHITGNSSVNNTSYGIYLSQDAGNNIVSNNKVVNNGDSGICVTGGYKEMLIIMGNEINGNSGKGIELQSATNINDKIQIVDNIIYKNGKNGISITDAWKNIVISGNIVKNNSQAVVTFNYTGGIHLECASTAVTMSNITVSNNLILDDQATKTQQIGVKTLNTGLQNVFINANNIVGYNYTSGLVIGGTLTNVAVKNNTGYNDGVPVVVNILSPSSSPWTHTTGIVPETLYLIGTGITITIGGNTMITSASVLAIPLLPNQTVSVTYTTLTSAKVLLQ